MEQIQSSSSSSNKPFTEVDRGKYDLEQANAMRRRKSNTPAAGASSQAAAVTKDSPEAVVALGLRGLDEADVLREQGRSQAALELYQSAIEVLVRMLQCGQLNQHQVAYDKEALSERVKMALSDAEQVKELIRRQQTQPAGEATSSSSSSSPLVKTCFTKISQYLASVRNTSATTSAATTTTNTNVPTTSRRSPNVQQSTAASQRQLRPNPVTTVTRKTASARSLPTLQQQQQQQQRNQAQHQQQQQYAKSLPTSPSSESTPPPSSSLQLLANKEADVLRKTVVDDMYMPPSQLQSTTWEDIAGLADAKQALQEAAIMPLVRPDLFTGLRKPQNILLYGAPGTGKTLLVKAVAYESQSALFLCTASAVTSKWHGDSEKLVRVLFQVARESSPSIIFIDEIDALLSTRKSEGEHEASRRFKTEFMVQMDSIQPKNNNTNNNHTSVLMIACTNCPWDVDSAVLRRFSRRIFVPLPDKEARKALVKSLLKTAGKHSLSKTEISEVVKRLRGFSGSDIQSIASEASFMPLRSVGSLDAIRTIRAKDVRPISKEDFDKAMGQATKSVTKEELAKYDDWKTKQSASSS